MHTLKFTEQISRVMQGFGKRIYRPFTYGKQRHNIHIGMLLNCQISASIDNNYRPNITVLQTSAYKNE